MRSTVGSANGAAAICKDNGRPSARLNPHGIAIAGNPPTLNGIVTLGALTRRSSASGSAGSATLSAAAVTKASMLQGPRLLPPQRGAPAQRLQVIFAADQRAWQHPVAQDAAEILRARAHIVLVDRGQLERGDW